MRFIDNFSEGSFVLHTYQLTAAQRQELILLCVFVFVSLWMCDVFFCRCIVYYCCLLLLFSFRHSWSQRRGMFYRARIRCHHASSRGICRAVCKVESEMTGARARARHSSKYLHVCFVLKKNAQAFRWRPGQALPVSVPFPIFGSAIPRACIVVRFGG